MTVSPVQQERESPTRDRAITSKGPAHSQEVSHHVHKLQVGSRVKVRKNTKNTHMDEEIQIEALHSKTDFQYSHPSCQSPCHLRTALGFFREGGRQRLLEGSWCRIPCPVPLLGCGASGGLQPSCFTRDVHSAL